MVFPVCDFQIHHGVREQGEDTPPAAGKTGRYFSDPVQREQQRRRRHLQLGRPLQWWCVSQSVFTEPTEDNLNNSAGRNRIVTIMFSL